MGLVNRILGPFLLLLPDNNRIQRIWKIAQIDFKKRYYNDSFGVLWALINPFFRISIYYFVFKTIMNVQIENYALFLFNGIIMYGTFGEVTKGGMNLLQAKGYLIETIKFDITDLYISHSISVLIGFFYNILAYLLISVITGVALTWYVLLLPFILINVLMIGVGIGFILSVLKIYFKDIKHIWDLLLLAGFWVSGIFFNSEVLFEKYPVFVYANPLVGIIQHTRNLLLFGKGLDPMLASINLLHGIIFLVIGYIIFSKYSKKALEKI